ncbi:MAG: amidohydrolase family protein [Anaerolineae bacterium]|nr:amidohydrolase family protein [Anaerolineae bacterium]
MERQLTIPGMIDPHVHLRGLDWSHKATFATETGAALAGGYWAVLDMPNTPPTTTTPAALDSKLDAIGSQAVCDWGVYYGASQNDNAVTYAQVIGRVCGLKIYNNATTGTLLIDDQVQRAHHYRRWPKDRVIAVHAEGETVRDILALVVQYRVPTHFCHISTAEEIGFLREAKAQGLPVSVGVTPHHLFLTEDDARALGALGRMKPELKRRADQAALWRAIEDGVVDVVESDHAPHTLAEKASDDPPYGVPGLETTLPLLCTAVRAGRLTVDRLIELVALGPQRLFDLIPPDGTYTVVDVETSFAIERSRLRTQCGWSPFEGMRVSGRVCEVWIRGRQVFDGEHVLAAPGSGINLFDQGGQGA